MNKFICILLSSSVLFAANGDWQVESVCSNPGTGYTPSIALDSNGNPHMCHSGVSSVWHTWKNGAVWETEFIYGHPYGGTTGPDILIDSSDLCHVSFGDMGAVLHYAAQTPISNGWVVEGITPWIWAMLTSVDLNASGYPAIASSGDDLVTFVESDGVTWTSTVICSTAVGENCNSLVIDDEGTPHVVYSSDALYEGLMYSHRDQSGTWQTMVVDVFTGDQLKGASIALDSSGYPHISYNTSSGLRHSFWNGVYWTIDVIDAVDTGMGVFDTSLALDGNDVPHIAYCLSSGDSLMMAVKKGYGWVTQSVCPIAFNHGGDPDLVLDESGGAHIAFYAGIYGDGLMYAYNSDPTQTGSEHHSVESVSFSVWPNPFSCSLGIQFHTPVEAGSTVRIHDVSGRLVTELDAGAAGNGSSVLYWHPDSSIPDGTYLVVIDAGTQRVTERCVLLR